MPIPHKKRHSFNPRLFIKLAKQHHKGSDSDYEPLFISEDILEESNLALRETFYGLKNVNFTIKHINTIRIHAKLTNEKG